MAEGKWFPGLTAEMPADEAATRVLTVRLKAVAAALPLAVEAPDESEHVHQLRVATRRASAAVSIFRYLIPKKPRQQVKNNLRALRRAAGEARNWDVFLDHLESGTVLAAKNQQAAWHFLAGYAFCERDLSQLLLTSAAAECGPAIEAAWKEIPQSLRKSSRQAPSVAQLGEIVLAEQATELIQLSRNVSTDPIELHTLRIAAKRLRYALEIFAMGLQPVYRETVIPALSQLQECLGTLQDCHVQVTRLTQALASLKAMRPDIHQKVRAGVMTLVRESRQVATREMRTYRTRIKEWNQLASSSPLADLILVADPHQTLAG